MTEKAPRKLKAQVVNAEATVSVDKKSSIGETVGSSSTKNEHLGQFDFQAEPAVVGIEYGLTINMGNFESARVSVSVRVPCAPKDLDSTYESTKEWATQRVAKEVAEIRNFMKNPDGAL